MEGAGSSYSPGAPSRGLPTGGPRCALRTAGLKEQKLFLRGLFPSMGFRSDSVYYARLSRRAGETKYSFWKMLSFAWQGITSCSAAPLRLAGIMSFLCMLAAVGYSLVSLYKYMAGETIQGWTSMIIVVLCLVLCSCSAWPSRVSILPKFLSRFGKTNGSFG